MLTEKTILVTGGTGTFGFKMVKYLIQKGCREIRVFSRDESKQDSMRMKLNNPIVKFYIGDVRDRSSVDNVMKGVDLVFHAAALKQVPSCEFFPVEALRTNVLGSENVMESAIVHGVESLVCLGTDKSVYPVNAMGMTKALMEKVAQSISRKLGKGDTVISCVRYGNVLYSRGSVVPVFVSQIKANQPITVTDSKMTRFLLHLDDAIGLVEFAMTHAQQGDVFVKKAPSCTMGNLAQALKNLFQSDVPIKIIGIRHGEKVYETLLSHQELLRSDDMGDYYRVRMDGRDLNYKKYFTEGNLEELSGQDYNSNKVKLMTVPEIEEKLLGVPEIKDELDTFLSKK